MIPRLIDLPSIAYIVARSAPDHIIGCDNKVPWRLRTDMRRFREITSGHVVIMGRKTHDSIGKVLPDRINIVVSRRRGSDSADLLWAGDRETALFFADHFSLRMGRRTIFVIGGEEIYRMFEPLFNKIYLTEVHARNIPGDAYFDFKFDHRKWETIQKVSLPASEEDEFPSDFVVYNRRTKYVRQVELWRFLADDQELEQKLPNREEYQDLIRRTRRNRQKIDKIIRDLEVLFD